MRKIRRNDEVVVLTGRDRGKRGNVVRVIDAERVIVSGINMVKKHERPNPQAGRPGGIVEREASIHVSNVAIWNRETGRADRVAIEVAEDGKRRRIFKSNRKAIDG
jgi:large subunit ribosomal protein L24